MSDLEEEVARLREALRRIVESTDDDYSTLCNEYRGEALDLIQIAREALGMEELR